MCLGYGYPYTQSTFGYKGNKVNKMIILTMYLFLLRYIEVYLASRLTDHFRGSFALCFHSVALTGATFLLQYMYWLRSCSIAVFMTRIASKKLIF